MRFPLVLVAVSALHVAAPTAAWGAQQSPGRCAALKAKATGLRVAASLGCQAAATRKGRDMSSACLDQARKKFERLFAKADKNRACGAAGDAATIGDSVTVFAATVGAVIFPRGTADGARSCAAKKMLRAGAYGRGRLACWARALRAGVAVDGACFDSTASKLVVGFGAAEAKPGCATAGDASIVERELNGFVDGVAALIMPVTTSTAVSTSTTSTTTQGLVSFSADVQPIFTANCALVGCHAAPGPQEGLNLSPGRSYETLVNVTSRECGQFERVQPGQPEASYVVFKIEGPPQACFSGDRMPADAPPLPAADRETIRTWILQGALNN